LAKFRTAAAVEFGRVPLYPAPYRDVIDAEVPLSDDLFELTQAQRVPEVPPDAKHDHVGFEVSPFEQRRPLPSHAGRSVSDSPDADATQPMCGCDITDLNAGTDWHTAGDFTLAARDVPVTDDAA
jgi:hypothetical protein